MVFSRCHRDVRGDASQPVGRRFTRCLLVSRRTDSFRRCAQRPSDARTSSHTPFRTTRQQGSSSFVRRDHHARLRCAAPGRKEIILNTSVVSVSRMPPIAYATRDVTGRTRRLRHLAGIASKQASLRRFLTSDCGMERRPQSSARCGVWVFIRTFAKGVGRLPPRGQATASRRNV